MLLDAPYSCMFGLIEFRSPCEVFLYLVDFWLYLAAVMTVFASPMQPSSPSDKTHNLKQKLLALASSVLSGITVSCEIFPQLNGSFITVDS